MTARTDVVDGRAVVLVDAGSAETVARTILAAGRVLSRSDPGFRFEESIQRLIGLLGEVGSIADVGNLVAESRARVVESILTTDEVAKECRLSPRRVRQLAESGELPGRQAGSGWIFHAESVAEFINKRRSTTWAS